MFKMRDFFCNSCQEGFEALVKDGNVPTHGCGSMDDVEPRISGGRIFTTIVATSRTSGRYKAGSVHRFQNRPAEKIQVGFTGDKKSS